MHTYMDVCMYGLFTIPCTNIQDIVAINRSIQSNTLYTRPQLVSAFETAKAKTGRVHFLGLVSDGGVHSHITHLESLLVAAKKAGVPKCFLHFFSDGRDTSPVGGGKLYCGQVFMDYCIIIIVMIMYIERL